MKKQNYWILIFIVILALAGLACNAILGDDAEPTAESTITEPVATVPAESEGSETGGEPSGSAAPTLDLSPENNFGVPSDLSSFRINLDVQFEETKADGTVESGRITAAGAQVLDPLAMTFDFTVEGTETDLNFGGSVFSMTQIDDVIYLNLAETGCISTSGNEFDSFLTDFTNSENFVGGLQGAQLVEENVTINGVQTNHYRFDDAALTQQQQAFGTFQNVEGHVYVSTEEGYLVRITMEADGANLNLSGDPAETTNGHVVYQIDYSDFNAPIDITVPEGCAGEGEYEFPVLDDATNVNSFGDLLTYSTGAAFDDIVEFYNTEMAAAGYTLASDFSSPPTALLTYEQDGQEVTVTVAEDPEGDGFLVTIIKG